MNKTTLTDIVHQQGGFITTKDLSKRSEYEQMRRATQEGSFVRIRKGIYADIEALAGNMVDIERIVPQGVLCLYTAFMYHHLSTQVPAAICVAIEAKRKVRLPDYPIIDLYYWKKENLTWGISVETINGYQVRITDPERTVCDALKYRNKIGLDVCGEVLNSYLERTDRNISLLHHYAGQLRMGNILNPHCSPRSL